jgi:hypothetical protein
MGNCGMQHAFSIEMKSKTHVRHISMSDESHDRVLFEGYLGDLKELSLIEGTVLEVRGENGVLRIDLSEEELRNIFSKKEAPKED